MILRRAALVAVLAAVPAVAQIAPQPATGDPHLQFVNYDSGQIVQLRGAAGYQLMVELSPDEQVQSVALGDSTAWAVSINKAGDRLFIKPLQALVPTNMTVVTSVRVYNFELVPLAGPEGDMPYTVRFQYPAVRPEIADGQYVDVSAAARRLSKYRISGARAVRPLSISDDGQRTYISWPKGASIPAVYALDGSGREVLVNGMMGTDDVYIVDGAPQRLSFRIDRTVARAERVNPRKGH
jgi:type IV secretion system protein VirB9